MRSDEDVTARSWRGVVAGFDETDRGRCAVRWAAEQAVRRSCPLYVVAVLEPATPVTFGWAVHAVHTGSGQRSSAETRLLAEVDACRHAYPGLDVHGVLHDGRPCDRLAEYASQVGADLVAVGCSAGGPLSTLLLGSTADELARTAGRPVVAVRDPTPVQQASVLTGRAPVVVGLEEEDVADSGPVLDFAFDAAADSGSDLAVVAARPVGRLGPWRARYPGVPVTVEVVGDAVAATLLARSEEARLLVVGDRRRRTVRHLLTGSATRAALRRAACSVAVIGLDQPPVSFGQGGDDA